MELVKNDNGDNIINIPKGRLLVVNGDQPYIYAYGIALPIVVNDDDLVYLDDIWENKIPILALSSRSGEVNIDLIKKIMSEPDLYRINHNDGDDGDDLSQLEVLELSDEDQEAPAPSIQPSQMLQMLQGFQLTEAPVAPETSDGLVIPEASMAPEASEATETPMAPETSEAPETPMAPEAPMAPAMVTVAEALDLDDYIDTELPMPDFTPAPVSEPAPEPEPEPEPTPELFFEEVTYVLDDGFDLSELGEIAQVIEVSDGKKVVQYLDTMGRAGDLLGETKRDPESHQLKRNALENMVMAANATAKMDIGSLLYNHRGLPSWIVPMLLVTKNTLKGKFNDIKAPWIAPYIPEKGDQAVNGVLLQPELPVPIISSMHTMDTDPVDQPAGGWLRERSDNTNNVVYLTMADIEPDGRIRGGSKEVSKFKTKQYSMLITLKDFAQNKLDSSADKKKSRGLYGRLIASPNNILSITTYPTFESEQMKVVGLVMRKIGKHATSRIGIDESIINVDTSRVDTSRPSRETMINLLNTHYPKIDWLLIHHNRYLARSTNISAVVRLLAKYKYKVTDLRPENYKFINGMSGAASHPSSSTWSADHLTEILSMAQQEPAPRRFGPNDYLDNGRLHHCKQLVEHLRATSQSREQLRPLPLAPVPAGRKFDLWTASIHLYEGDLYYKYKDSWYTRDNYNTMVRNEAYAFYNAMINLRINDKDVSEQCDQLSYSYTSIQNYLSRFTRGAIEQASKEGKIQISNEAQQLMSFDLSTGQGGYLFKTYLETYITYNIAGLVEGFYRILKTGEIICCLHVYNDLCGISIDELADNNGVCQHCGIAIQEQLQKDDFNQLNQTTDRNMIYFADSGKEEQGPDTRMLEILIHTVLTLIGSRIRNRYAITPNSFAAISEVVIKYILDNYPELVDIYQTNKLPSKPIGKALPSNITAAMIYGKGSVDQTNAFIFDPEIMPIVIGPHLTNIYGGYPEPAVLAGYVKDHEKCKCGKKRSQCSKPTDHKTTSTVFVLKNIYALSMLKPISEVFGIVLAYTIKQLDTEYETSTGETIMEGANTQLVIDLVNKYHEVMGNYVNTSLKQIQMSSLDSAMKEINVDRYESMKILFSGSLDMTIYESGLLHDFKPWEHLVRTYNKIAGVKIGTGLNNIGKGSKGSKGGKGRGRGRNTVVSRAENSLAEFEERYNGLYINIEEEPEVYDPSDAVGCLVSILKAEGEYCRRLWQHYGRILDQDAMETIALRPMNSIDILQNPDRVLSINELLQYGKVGVSITDTRLTLDESTFYDALTYSHRLLYNEAALRAPVLRTTVGDTRTASANYVENEQILKTYCENLSSITEVEQKPDPSIYDCTNNRLNSTERHRNAPFKREPEFKLNSTPLPTGVTVAVVGRVKTHVKKGIDPDLKRRLLMLLRYAVVDNNSYTRTLHGVFNDNKQLLESEISTDSQDSIFTKDYAMRKINDRKLVEHYKTTTEFERRKDRSDIMTAFKELQKEMGFPGTTQEWPLPTVEPPVDEELMRRKISRVQQLGIMIKKYLSWLAVANSDEEKSAMEFLMTTVFDAEIGRKSYTNESSILDTTGYFSAALFAIRKAGTALEFKMNRFDHFIPEIYNMSYTQFHQICMSDPEILAAAGGLISHFRFRTIVSAAIRYDLLLHYRFIVKGSGIDVIRNVTDYNDPEGDEKGKEYAKFLDTFFRAINFHYSTEAALAYEGYLDPDRNKIDELFDIRFSKEISRRMTTSVDLKAAGVALLDAKEEPEITPEDEMNEDDLNGVTSEGEMVDENGRNIGPPTTSDGVDDGATDENDYLLNNLALEGMEATGENL